MDIQSRLTEGNYLTCCNVAVIKNSVPRQKSVFTCNCFTHTCTLQKYDYLTK